jgi:3-oxoacyl-[acyl-carrier protein] reductase
VLSAIKRGGWAHRADQLGRRRGRPAGPGGLRRSQSPLHGLNLSLALGLGRAGILSDVVMPGFVETERNRQWVPRFAFEQRASATPTGRLATTEDIASAVTFLASGANRSITGEAVRVTGGL